MAGEEDRSRGVTGGREEEAVEEDSMEEWVWWRCRVIVRSSSTVVREGGRGSGEEKTS